MKTLYLTILLSLVLINCITTSSYAQASGTIKGSITNINKEPLIGISIGLEGTTLGSTTDQKGNYKIASIPTGVYTLVVSGVSYEKKREQINVESDKTLNLSFIMNESTNELTEVVVHSNSAYTTENISPSLRLMSPILETPQNIQVVTNQVLADQQIFNMLEGVSRNVSGAQKLEHWDNYARINMRGSQLTSFRNGMNVQMPWGPLTEDMSMVERIEFVKGPAGFMLANGEPSGFYNVVTKKPTGQEKGEVTFSLGSFNNYRTTADYTGKLSKNGKLLYRINLMGQLSGSHRDFEYNNKYAVAPSIKYLLGDKTSVTLEYTHQFAQMNVIGSNYAFSRRGYADLPRNFTTAEKNLDPSKIYDNSLLAIIDHSFNKNWKLTAQGAYFHYSQVGQSLWPWMIQEANDSLMQRGVNIWDALGINKTAQVFVTGKTQTGALNHNLIGGIDISYKDYYADWNQGAALGDSTFNIYKPVYGISESQLPKWDRSKPIKDRAVTYISGYKTAYLQDEIALLQNKVRITVAGRYTINNVENPYNGNAKDGKFTPRFGLSASVTPKTTAYFVYDQAFLANPGFNWEGKTFDPITGDNIEVGIKKDWFNGKWNTVLSAYQITKNNVLTTDYEHPERDEEGNVTGFPFSKQTGQQQVRGIEIDVRGEVLRNLDVVVNYAYTDGRITKDSDVKVVGNNIAGATKHIQNSWVTYSIAKGILEGLEFSLGYQYQAGRSSWYIFDNSANALPDYFRVDGGISYRKNKFNINFNVNNINNKYLFSGAPYGSLYYWQTEPGRNVRVTVGYKF